MPNILISEITPSTKESAKGEALSGIWVRGTQLVDQHNFKEKPWEKFYFDFTEEPEMFKHFKPGDAVKIKNSRDGKFWTLDSVTPMENVQRSVPKNAPDDSPEVASKVSSGKSVTQYREPAVLIRSDACRLAVDLATALLINGKYKKTATAVFILQDILESAKKFTAFMENKPMNSTAGVPSDNDDDDSGEEANHSYSPDPSLARDDDIPF